MLFFFFCLLFSLPSSQFDLPEGATIIETRRIPSKSHPQRALVLWMLNPERHPREPADDPYTCPEYTRGHHYTGPTRISLVDLQTNKIINTIKVKASDGEEGSLDLPYKIARGYYYRVVKSNAKEAKPIILALKDFNGDGKAYEFVLYDAAGCMGLETALIGYSERQDKVIQYHTVLTTKEKTTAKTETLWWVDYLFSKQANKNGVWKYEIDYRGRGGTIDQYAIRYNAKQERFEGTLTFKE